MVIGPTFVPFTPNQVGYCMNAQQKILSLNQPHERLRDLDNKTENITQPYMRLSLWQYYLLWNEQ